MTEPVVNHSPVEDHTQKWLVLVAVGGGTLLATIDSSIVNVALPTLVDELDTSFNVIQWVTLAYLLTIATLTLGAGRLGDVVGKKKLYLAGLGMFTVASALCGLAPGVAWLIGFRVLQASGAVMVLALGAAILVEAFPDNQRGTALGWVGSMVSVGIVSGPVLGGLLLSIFGWRAIFFVNLPVGVIAVAFAVRHLPMTLPARGHHFDVAGSLLVSISLFCLSLGLTLSQDFGFGSPLIIASLASATIAAVAFVVVELRVNSPVLQVRLFRSRQLSVGVASALLAFLCLSATVLLLPFYLIGVLELHIGTVGLLLAAAPLAMGLVSPVSGALSDRFGVRLLTVVGLGLMAVTYLAMARLGSDTSAGQYLLLTVPMGLAFGLFSSPNNSAIMGAIPGEYSGVGGGLLTVTRLLGQISGIAILGTIWATRVASASSSPLPPEGAAGADPAAQVAGLHTTFLTCAVVMAISAATAAWVQRDSHPGGTACAITRGSLGRS